MPERRVHGIINKDAFYDMTSHGAKGKEYGQNLNYPFTSFGDEEIKKDWYLKFRNSKMVVIIRDILTVVVFLLSLYIAIMNVIEK